MGCGGKKMIYAVFILAILINGATDAANSITGVVCCGILPYRRAAVLSALLNFAGLVIFSAFSPKVMETVGSLAVGGEGEALSVLLTVAVFAGGAWMFSLPTSESHALVAALAGVALAKGQGADFHKLLFITLGALVCALLGALFGAAVSTFLKESTKGNRALALMGCTLSSFFHGAQDGQKFLALAVATHLLDFNIFSVVLVGAAMFLGTLIGGRRIVEKLGEKMTHLSLRSAVSSDIGSALSLCIITLLGIPSSTTHTKTCAIAGAAAGMGTKVDKKELLFIAFGWILTIPVCIALAYFITKTINQAQIW